jgi:hypothetical protein
MLKIPIGKSGRMVEIGKIPPESGMLAGMGEQWYEFNPYDLI